MRALQVFQERDYIFDINSELVQRIWEIKFNEPIIETKEGEKEDDKNDKKKKEKDDKKKSKE